jgi:hypothetical protein
MTHQHHTGGGLKPRIVLLLMSVSISANALAQGNYSAAFLEIPLGARALALGGQFSPIDNTDGSAFFWNPAAVSFTKGQLLSTMYSNQFGSIGDPLSHYFHLGYTQNLGNGVGVSINWIRNSVSDIPLNDDPRVGGSLDINNLNQIINGGLTVGQFSNSSDALFLTVSKNVLNRLNLGWQYFNLPLDLPIGVTFKYIREGFSGNGLNEFVGSNSVSGTGIGVDLGAMARFNVNDFVGSRSLGELAVGATVRDLFNTPISWNTTSKSKAAIPRAFIFSVSYQQPLPFLSSTILGVASRDDRYGGLSSFGAEYRYKNLLSLRIGSYNKDVTLGAGLIILRALFVDYAYQNSELGSPHRVSLSVKLDEWL